MKNYFDLMNLISEYGTACLKHGQGDTSVDYSSLFKDLCDKIYPIFDKSSN